MDNKHSYKYCKIHVILVVNREYSAFDERRANGRHIDNTIEAEFVHIVKTRKEKYYKHNKTVLENISDSINSISTLKKVNSRTNLEAITERIPEDIVKLYKHIEETLIGWFPVANKRYLEKKNVVLTTDRNFIMLSVRRNYITIKLLSNLVCSDPESRFNDTSKINDAPYSIKYNINSIEDFLYCKNAINDSYNISMKKA